MIYNLARSAQASLCTRQRTSGDTENIKLAQMLYEPTKPLTLPGAGGGMKWAWPPTIHLKQRRMTVTVPSTLLTVNPARNLREDYQYEGLATEIDQKQYLSSEAQGIVHQAVLSAVHPHTGELLSQTKGTISPATYWVLRTDIEDSIMRETPHWLHGLSDIAPAGEQGSTTSTFSFVDGNALEVTVRHSDQLAASWPSHSTDPIALLSRRMTFLPELVQVGEPGQSDWQIQLAIPSLQMVSCGVPPGQLVCQLSEPLLEQMTAATAVLIRRLYKHAKTHSNGPSELDFSDWLQANNDAVKSSAEHLIQCIVDRSLAWELPRLPENLSTVPPSILDSYHGFTCPPLTLDSPCLSLFAFPGRCTDSSSGSGGGT